MPERNFGDLQVSPVDAFIRAMAKDMAYHPTPQMILSSVSEEPEASGDVDAGSFVARVVSAHFDFCGKCTEVREVISREVADRPSEFKI